MVTVLKDRVMEEVQELRKGPDYDNYTKAAWGKVREELGLPDHVDMDFIDRDEVLGIRCPFPYNKKYYTKHYYQNQEKVMKEVAEMLRLYEYYLNQGMVVLAMEYKNRADYLMAEQE